MDRAQFISSILIAVFAIVGTGIAIRRRKKSGPEKREEFYQHLKGLGMQAYLVERNDQREKIGIGRGTGQKSEGFITLENSNIEFINIISIASQYGVNYFLDYLVENPKLEGNKSRGKIRLKKKKDSLFRGKVIGIEWKGVNPLSQRLNFDYRLKDTLLTASFKGNIEIVPEPKWRYTRIRTQYFFANP
ncbi:MAG: hypothetical protein U9R04_04615 [Chloroflexota bacterium]|nr:hypothetical protein [Chloroflexota bacterium]